MRWVKRHILKTGAPDKTLQSDHEIGPILDQQLHCRAGMVLIAIHGMEQRSLSSQPFVIGSRPNIGIHATQTAAVELRGSGDVTVTGPAHCTISKSGSGDVHCGA